MGVHGLWRLIEPSGKPVPLETLENKVLAVDVSIWLHQAIKGFQDSKGAPVPNAHLLGIYHRVCKLLYFKVKPVFIFDGGVPALKKQTIAKRHQQKSRNISEAERLQKQLLSTLLKHTAISKVLSEKTKALALVPKKNSKHENMYALPPSDFDSTISSSEDEESDYTSNTTDSSPTKHWDLHTIDMSSVHFKSLPVDVRHEILTELKETRKQNSWGKLHELPRQSDDFSVYQMKRLLKRQAVQSALEDAEKEMGGHSLSMAELESILKDHGVATTNDVGKRIASDENTRYLLIKDVKQAMENARKEEQLKLESQQTENTEKVKVQDSIVETEGKAKTKADLEYEEDLQQAIALSLQEEPSTSKTEKVTDDNGSGNKLEFSFLENFRDEDFQSDSSEEFEEVSTKKTFSSAQHYMMEYSGLTPNEIAKILHSKNKQPLKRSKRKKIIVKRAMVDTVEIMSDSDESDEFVEVSLKEQKNDISVSSEKRVKYTNEASYCIEISKGNETEITSDTKFNESTEKAIVNNSNEVLKHKHVEITSTREESDAFRDDTKNNSAINNDTTYISAKNVSMINTESTAIKSNEVLTAEESGALNNDTKNSSVIKHDTINVPAENVSVINTEKYAVKPNEISTTEESDAKVKDDTRDIPAKNITNEKIEESLEVDIISDSDSNSSVEFVEVSVNKRVDNLIEIVIDPNESIKDDLFDDIFHEKEESQIKESTAFQPESKLDKDLHSDAFTDKSTVVEETNTPLGKQMSETKKSLEVIKEDEVLVTQNMAKSREEDATSSKSENIVVIKNSMAVNLKNLKASNLDKPLQNNEIQEEMRKIERQKLNVDEMRKLKNELQNEKIDLMIEKSTKERMASNITDQMSQEAQDLLELFGVPYIVAPMEAEAQCAFLDEIELTDGTITDDSDIWLFGGRTVYKNFFNQSKYVMEFKAEDIKHNFKLTREQMILFALLVGSDYTTGLQGIGPVTALEILAAFPPSIAKEISLSHAQLLSGLKEFRTWFNRGKTAGPGRSALKNKLNNVSFTDNFPSLQVVQAYLEPTVETSREKFSWAKPNFIGLKEFAREKFGWSTKKTEEILKPVIKKVEETRVQKTIKDFFKTVHKVELHEAEKKMSKRVKTAIDRIGKTPDELIAEEMEVLSREKQKRARKKNVVTDRKAQDKDVQIKPTRKRTKQKENKDISESSKSTVAHSEDDTRDELIIEKMESLSKEKQKGTRKKKNVETDQKTEDNDVTKPTRKRTKQKKNEGASESSKVVEANGEDIAEDVLTKQMVAPKPKRPRKKNDKAIDNTSAADKISTTVKDSEENQTIEMVDEDSNSLETYENIAMELKKRRQRKIDLSNQDDIHKKKQYRPPPKKMPPTESIPKVLEEDEEVKLLQATTSRSLKRVEEIDQEVKNELSQDVKKKRLPDFHKKEVIHQKLRDKSDLLRNKLKAIEVFRKSKKGPGYVKKQNRKIRLPKEDAALSENSSDE